MVQGVNPFPIALGFGCTVLIVEDQTPRGSGSPFEVQVLFFGTLAVWKCSINSIERFFFDLKKREIVERKLKELFTCNISLICNRSGAN